MFEMKLNKYFLLLWIGFWIDFKKLYIYLERCTPISDFLFFFPIYTDDNNLHKYVRRY